MSKKVRAKFNCTEVTDNGYNKMVKFSAVSSESGENADFAKATLSGTLEIWIDSETPASEFFKPQKDYYLDFTEVE